MGSREPWIIKVNAKNYDWITKNYTGGKFTGGKKLYTIMMDDDINIRWRKTKVTPSSPNTQMQELGSAWILERVINDNKTTFKSVQDIVDDKVTYEKLVQIFRGDVPEDWLFTFLLNKRDCSMYIMETLHIRPSIGMVDLWITLQKSALPNLEYQKR